MKKYIYRLEYLSKNFTQAIPTEVIVVDSSKLSGLDKAVIELAAANNNKVLDMQFTANNQRYKIIEFKAMNFEKKEISASGTQAQRGFWGLKAPGASTGIADAKKIREAGVIRVSDNYRFGRQADFTEALFNKKPQRKGYFRIRGDYYFWAPKLCKDTVNFTDVGVDFKVKKRGEKAEVQWTNILSEDGADIYEGEIYGNLNEDYAEANFQIKRVTFVQEKINIGGTERNTYRFAGIFQYTGDTKIMEVKGQKIKFVKFVRIAGELLFNEF